jgi:hypothetical protein
VKPYVSKLKGIDATVSNLYCWIKVITFWEKENLSCTHFARNNESPKNSYHFGLYNPFFTEPNNPAFIKSRSTG